ncbi:ribosome biogenesis GTPase Der [Candidatus Wolfebacteria bacterium RBG_13_41_7]|uniref:GTPase Der n=1 Tax=Candidatus Wolfebacteria bacterium RBG_13_41_7 TaxID=1802554 RepID=A0A1F8DQN0_9BACT|nr:MAG: ribosome biogenesis GTPase Der [Candidatus Wolfebacteria bacterium RBG_13_41_7]
MDNDINKSNLSLVVIFGRTNVGKSTLFNRLLEKNQALVSAQAGTTRDANVGEVGWSRRKFKLVDTGGIIDLKNLTQKSKLKNAAYDGKTDDIDVKVQSQASQYLKKADLILFVTDARDGLMPPDRQMAVLVKILALSPDNAKIILVANKADNPNLRRQTAEFNKLGLGEPIAVSAATGSGTGDLLDAIISKLFKMTDEESQKANDEIVNHKSEIINSVRVCIVGRPNTGKSSLANKLLGEDRLIVSSVPHTTREPQDITINYEQTRITFIDTAGLSRQGQKNAKQNKLKKSLEKLSINKSLAALARSDLALLVIDSVAGIDRGEQKIVDKILERKISLIIVANKWDLIKNKDTKKFTNDIYSRLPFITWAPIHFCSALTGEKVNKILNLILKINQARNTQIADNALGHFLNKIIKRHRPSLGKFAKRPHIHDFKQAQTNPPVFSLRLNPKDSLPFSYIKYIENRLREKFFFLGTPISIWVEKNKRVHGKTD